MLGKTGQPKASLHPLLLRRRIAKIESAETPIFSMDLYIDLESSAATHELGRSGFASQGVLRDAKEAIEPPTAA